MVLWCYNKKGDFYGVFFEKIEVKKRNLSSNL